ncbi:MAG: peptidoglycan DD-metalloendopeptidase family protein [Anaerolineae bacterium]
MTTRRLALRLAGFVAVTAFALALACRGMGPALMTVTPEPPTVASSPVPTRTATPTLVPTPVLESTLVPPTPTAAPVAVKVRLLPETIRQGDIVTIVIETDRFAVVTASLRGHTLPLLQEGLRWYALLGIWAATPPADWPLSVSATDPIGGGTAQTQKTIRITARAFEVENIDLDETTTNLIADTETLQSEAQLVAHVVAGRTADRLWQGPFLRPLQGEISSTYGLRRGYNGQPPTDYHGGLDLAADAGTPVGAANAGRVVFSGPLKVRGNAVIIDHGWGLYTGYYHLSAVSVQEGDFVTAGQTIGLVGSTGFSTGDHLHWSVWAGGNLVDPETILQWQLPE